MYYHVLIETGKSRITYVNQTDIYAIIEDIIIPYRQGTDFFVNGLCLTKKDIIKLEIYQSRNSFGTLKKTIESGKKIILTGEGTGTEEITNQILYNIFEKTTSKIKFKAES